MDDKTKTGKGDDSRINVNEPYEVQYWTKKINVTEAQLKEAVKAVGTSVKDIEDYFKK